MAGTSAYLPRFGQSAPDIFDATQQIRPLGASDTSRRSDRLAEAEERGRCQAREEARVELERVRAEDRADFELRLAGARQRWAEETGDRLAERMTAALDALPAAFAAPLARVLGPFLGKAVRQRAVDELSETVLALLHGGRHVALSVSGPRDLVERLSDGLAAYPHAVEISDEAPDVRVAIDDTIVETQIGAWIARLQAALAGEPHE